MKRLKPFCLWVTLAYCLQLVTVSCNTIDLYEKSVAIPGHSWKSSFKPSFAFTIKDTSSAYKLFIVLRHNDKYNFNNIYINLHVKRPGVDSVNKAQYDLTLATNEKGWLASGMDDIYEHRIPLTPDDQPVYFRKPGDYLFTIEQVMREDPLNNVLDIGLRIEKKQ
ncbi:MAG: gliding motility lipoprotein GldH [Sphingobacteriales bacterium]|nr:gliding motility lipoprotein GldH [Sphingobacteriales bacterium]